MKSGALFVTVVFLSMCHAGRVVRTFTDSRRERGLRTIEWDAKDDRGRTLPGGVYFTVLSVGDTRQIAKEILLR